MKGYIKKILFIIDTDKKKIPFLIVTFCFLSFLDILGISLLIPIVTSISSGEITIPGVSDDFLNMGLSEPKDFTVLSLFIIGVFVIKGFFAFFVQRKILNFGYSIQELLIQKLLFIYQRMPYQEIGQRNSSAIIQTVIGNLELFNFNTLIAIVRLTAELIACTLIIIFLCLISIEATLIIGILAIITFYLYDKIFRSGIVYTGKQAAVGREGVIKGLNESLSGYKVIRSLGLYNYFLNIIRENAAIMKTNTVRYKAIFTIPRYLIESSAVIFLMLFLAIAINIGHELDQLLATFTLFALAIVRLMPSFNAIVGSLSAMRNSKFTVDELYNDLKTYLPDTDKFYLELDKSQSSTQEVSTDFSEIKINKVFFRYKESDNFVLKDLSLNIKRGQVIGIIGNSGAGKTTLLDLIVGIHSPETGKILVDERDVSENFNLWLSKICYLPQNPFLTDDTIKNNICLAIPEEEIDFEKLDFVLGATKLSSYINDLPDGLETGVGEEGIKVSGGQKQRIAMARALYYDRTIFIMDEGTSALDKSTEHAILEQINAFKGDRTFIIIAHNLSTLRHCDSIFELSEGSIIKEHKYSDLIGDNRDFS
ncbi:ABC transporter ATP-binding protein/permease [Gammaproteobacteria bacterium]|nr:ABC transporter ATP-binding protein/permease [Gammaproteobacteria bacterium]